MPQRMDVYSHSPFGGGICACLADRTMIIGFMETVGNRPVPFHPDLFLPTMAISVVEKSPVSGEDSSFTRHRRVRMDKRFSTYEVTQALWSGKNA